jgi:hypothetical protein
MPPQSMNIDPTPSLTVHQMPHYVENLSITFVMLLSLQNVKQEVLCGALTLLINLFDMSSLNIDLSVLNTASLIYSKERIYSAEPIFELDRPVIDTSHDYICISCQAKVRYKKLLLQEGYGWE